MLEMLFFKPKKINRKYSNFICAKKLSLITQSKNKSDNTLQTDSSELVLRSFQLIASSQPENMSSNANFVQKENYTSKGNISVSLAPLSEVSYYTRLKQLAFCTADTSDGWEELWEKKEVKKLSPYLGIKP